MTDEERPVDFSLWLHLPRDVALSILCSFIDGKALSTFMIAAQGCRRQHRAAFHSGFFRDIVEQRLQSLERRCCNQEPPFAMETFLQLVRQHYKSNESSSLFPWRNLSECLAVCDYFLSYSTTFRVPTASDEEKEQCKEYCEFPVWVGSISIPLAGSVHLRDAVVVIWTPYWQVNLISDFIATMNQPTTNTSHREASTQLESTNYNYSVVPPIARVSFLNVDEGLCSSSSWSLGESYAPNQAWRPRSPSKRLYRTDYSGIEIYDCPTNSTKAIFVTRSHAKVNYQKMPDFLKRDLDVYSLGNDNEADDYSTSILNMMCLFSGATGYNGNSFVLQKEIGNIIDLMTRIQEYSHS